MKNIVLSTMDVRSPNMKILHVVNDAGTGGAQTLIEQLAIRQQPDIEVHILVILGQGPLSERFENCAASVTYLSMDRKSLRVDKLVSLTRRVIRDVRPDVVHSHLLQADLAVALASWGLQVSTISTVHTTGMTASDPLRSRILGRALGLLSGLRIEKLVACGHGAAEYMARNGYPAAKSSIINNGVQIPDKSEVRQPQPSRTLLSLARWHPMKDHRSLFEAFRLVRGGGFEVQLVCAGSGMTEENNELLDVLTSLGLRDHVQLLGPVADVRTLLRASDVLVISSSYGEALPMAGIEALAEATPVVATRVGDCSKLVVLGGQCVPPNAPDALANAISSVLAVTADVYGEISRKSQAIARDNFSINATAIAYEKLYAELTGLSFGELNEA